MRQKITSMLKRNNYQAPALVQLSTLPPFSDFRDFWWPVGRMDLLHWGMLHWAHQLSHPTDESRSYYTLPTEKPGT